MSVTPEARQALHDIAKSEGLSPKHLSETIMFLKQFYLENKDCKRDNAPNPEYSSSEQQEIDEAIANSGLTLEDIVKDGTLQRTRYLNSIASNQAKLVSMSNDELKRATFKGAAKYKITQAVELVMNHNNRQTEKKNKVCLTRGIIFKLTGSNRQTINKFFDDKEVMISDHNHKHQLRDTDNRKGKGFSFEELLGV